jgi:hypothetical protein
MPMTEHEKALAAIIELIAARLLKGMRKRTSLAVSFSSAPIDAGRPA